MTSFHYQTQANDETIEHLLRQKWQAGKKTVHLMRMAKSVTDTDGEPIDWRDPLPQGTMLHFTMPEAVSNYVEEENNLPIVYEDEHILVVNKPAGMDTHPDGQRGTGTVMNRIMHYVRNNGSDYAEHIHRLDKGTAGLILIAKHPIAKTLFDRMLANNEIERMYTAELDGYLKKSKGTLSYPIGRDRSHPTRRRVSVSGQRAVTHFKVIKRSEDTTIVEASLETGRTHQIRVHFSHIGHPVKGDTVYEGSITEDGQYRLTATKISFRHPFTEQPATIEI
ncbi:RluA family pseudouridine synthase [Sporosarcina sp. HYO08]|uniref:RluA family pseudouridine synthase n=1 Tax=Sporosarcina sp. HYO08 TaxID=1759557 RepID=UPI00079B362D|nr:RluA family pseudouridine synthase [Sporosarcina sp. HYO08]KXH79312.1 RNA pseudouridine synthase [Sporosarcina sp. HYO08]